MTLNAGDHRYKALIVDDEPSILQVLEQVLVDANFIVTTADNGEDAVAYQALS